MNRIFKNSALAQEAAIGQTVNRKKYTDASLALLKRKC